MSESINSEKTIGHFQLIEKLESSGMGIVYKALDTKLDRLVAIKFLPLSFSFDEEAKQQFINEARIISSLNHPNICTIHSIDETIDGQIYFVMDYYSGGTLKQKIKKNRLSLIESIAIFKQIADGIAKAHDNGIIHRDLNPSNIIFDEDGNVKILDFGLAKMHDSDTHSGVVKGTHGYMSPEQICGMPIDHRSDLWNLGIILYEMLCQKSPFVGESELEKYYSILHKDPIHLNSLIQNIPNNITEAISKSLSKNASDRFTSVEEFISALDLHSYNSSVKRRIWKSSRARRNIIFLTITFIPLILYVVNFYSLPSNNYPKKTASIAVLPFINLDTSDVDNYFVDGLSEELIARLSSEPNLKVIARTSSFSLKESNLDVKGIGNKLNVENILEGSVRKSGELVRMTARLINAKEGFNIWAGEYEFKLGDIFLIQDTISRLVTTKLLDKLAISSSIKRNSEYLVNSDAHLYYLKGLYFWNRRSKSSYENAIKYFSEAVKIDSNYSKAYSGLGLTYNLYAYHDVDKRKEVFENAWRYANKAIRLDSLSAEGWTSLGFTYERYFRDWARAELCYNKAINLNPSYATSFHLYGFYLVLHRKFDEGLKMVQNAIRIDPLSVNINYDYGQLLYMSRKYDEAEKQLLTTLEMNPDFTVINIVLSQVYEAQRKYDKAFYWQMKALNKSSDLTELTKQQNIFKTKGWKGYAEYLLEKSLDGFSKGIKDASRGATVNLMRLERYPEAIKWLQKMFDVNTSFVSGVYCSPVYNPIRNYPEFKALMKRAGYPEE